MSARRRPRVILAAPIVALIVVVLGAGGVAAGAKPKPKPKPPAAGQECHGTGAKPITLTNLPSAPDPSLLAILGVLRRPQVPADIPPSSPFPGPLIQGVEVAYERLLATTPDGERYFLVPGFIGPLPIATKCTPPLTAAELHHQQAVQQQMTLHPRFQLFISEFGPGGQPAGAGGGPSTVPALEAGLEVSGEFDVGGIRGGQETESGTIDSLVPDGVATVELEYHHRSARTLAVTNNFFVLSVHGRVKAVKPARGPNGVPAPPIPTSPFPPSSGPLGAIAPIEIVWRDAQGDVIRTVRQPAYCSARHGTALARCLATIPKP